jgi:hypothetical protein
LHICFIASSIANLKLKHGGEIWPHQINIYVISK